MTKDELILLIEQTFSAGDILNNPGGGVSTLVSVGSDKLSYIRGKSRMYLPYDSIFKVIEKYPRGNLTTNNLRQFDPSVFDQKHGGHNCNCTSVKCSDEASIHLRWYSRHGAKWMPVFC
jgi:hypothetical protein